MSLISTFLNEDVLGRPSSDPVTNLPAGTIAKREIFIAIRRDGRIGDGTRACPYNGANRELLDGILNGNFDNSLRSAVRFVFGPGIFRTAGSARSVDPQGPWTMVWEGQEFVGAGMFATTLRFELPEPFENVSYSVFGHRWYLDPGVQPHNLLVQDITIDCNLQNQRSTGAYGYPRITVSAAGFFASSGIRFKRVRVINSGTRTPDFELNYKAPRGLDNGNEAFPIFISSQTPYNMYASVVEDCIVEQPFHSNGREMTCIHMGGDGFNDHCAIRNCLVDCANVPEGPFPQVPIARLVFTATEGTLETVTQHDLKVGDKVIIAGAGAPYDGKHVVTVIPPDPHFPNSLHQWKAVLAPGPMRALHHTYLGTEHLLLALLHHSDNVLTIALKDRGVRIKDVRNEIRKELDPNFNPTD